MAYDLGLVDKCRETGDSYLRFYSWKPYAISLGYNQSRSSHNFALDYNRLKTDCIDVVERPTGGRAVFHSEELTYSVVMKTDKPIHDTYRDISVAIVNGLKTIEDSTGRINELSFTKDTPDLFNLIKTGMYNLCFNSQVKNEINFRGRKLVGSAQRKLGDIILQHGSLLLGSRHRGIVDYIICPDEEKQKMALEIGEKTVCLNDIAGRNMSYAETADAVLKGFVSTYGIKFSSINRLAELISQRKLDHESIMN